MNMISRLIVSAFCVLVLFMSNTPAAHAAETPHTGLITKYEGTATCKGCHPNAAREVAESLHYQQLAETPFLVGVPKGNIAGMMKSY